jgi:hypothetical protein
MDRLQVGLESWERAALRRLARTERRELEAQAAVLIRQGLEQAGVLRTVRPVELALVKGKSEGERGEA